MLLFWDWGAVALSGCDWNVTGQPSVMPKKIAGVALILLGIGLMAWAGITAWKRPVSLSTVTVEPLVRHPTPPWQAEPLIPTARPPSLSTKDQIDTQPGRPTIPPDLSFRPETIGRAWPNSANVRARFGVGVPYPPLEAETADKLGLGWYLAWRVIENPPGLEGVEYWQMIRVGAEGFRPDKTTLRRAVQTNPGATWLIGNEPDVIWQDNVTPARYAELYHDLYYFLKRGDPTCRVAIGGVTQPTPLRLQYLEDVLSVYQANYGEVMPVEIWNIHNFILREERDSWGVDIPPGLAADQGVLYEVDDHDDLDLFKTQLINFRQWLADRGQRNKPLIVSEYGILMPEDYGFSPERVKSFMYGTYDFMLAATDEKIGYPADDNRLVQGWAWFSLSDDRYTTGNLIDFETGELTEVGESHLEYVSNLP